MASVVRRLVRMSLDHRWCWWRSFAWRPACIGLSAAVTPTGLPAGGGSGRVLHRGAAAGRRLGRPHRLASPRRWRRLLQGKDPVDPERAVDRRLLVAGWRQSGRTAAIPRSRSFHEAVRGSDGPRGRQRPGGDRPERSAAAIDPGTGRTSIPLQPAADHRARRPAGGFSYQLQALEGQDPAAMQAQPLQGWWWRPTSDIRQLTRVFSTFSPTTPSIYLDIDRDKAQALGLAINGRVHRAAGHAGRHLRERLQPVRPHLAGADLQGDTLPTAAMPQRHLPHLRAQQNSVQMVPLRAIADRAHRAGDRKPSAATTTTAQSPSTALRRRASLRVDAPAST